MQYSVILESSIARERRRDLLHEVEQDRLVRLAQAGRTSGAKAGRRPRVSFKIWMTRRRASV